MGRPPKSKALKKVPVGVIEPASKPSSNGAFLTMGTAGTASWTTTIDGGTF